MNLLKGKTWKFEWKLQAKNEITIPWVYKIKDVRVLQNKLFIVKLCKLQRKQKSELRISYIRGYELAKIKCKNLAMHE